jgi:hypothetical protein
MWSRDTDKCLHSNGLAQLTMCPSLADGGWYGLNLMTITTYATGQQSKALPLLTKLCKWWASSDTSTRIIMSSLRLYVRVVSPLSIYDHIPVRCLAFVQVWRTGKEHLKYTEMDGFKDSWLPKSFSWISSTNKVGPLCQLSLSKSQAVRCNDVEAKGFNGHRCTGPFRLLSGT